MDGVVHKKEMMISYGIVKFVLRLKNMKCRKLVIRRFQEIEAEEGKNQVVHEYGNKRFKYIMGDTGESILELVYVKKIMSPCGIVLDPSWFNKKYEISTRFALEKEDRSNRFQLRFLK